jgi:CHAT domain-containing protein
LDAEADRQIMLRKTADAYLALNLYPEALAIYREAHQLLAQAGMADHQARALWGMGATLIALSRQTEAVDPLAEAARLFAAADNLPMLCSVRLEQAALQHSLGTPETAWEYALDALQLVAGAEWPVQKVYTNLRLADLAWPDPEAESYLAAARQAAETLNLPAISYRLEQRFGRLRLQQGRPTEARPYLEAAIIHIESLRGTLSQEAALTSFLRDKTAAYEDLVRLHLLENNPEQAFLAAEQAKSRTLVDLLTGVISVGSTADSSDLAGRLHHLRADLNAVYNDLLAPVAGQKSDPAVLQTRALWLEDEISRLSLEQNKNRPSKDPFTTSLSLEHLERRLPADMTLLAYHIIGREILAFVLQSGQVTVVRNLADTAVVQDLLQRLTLQWDRFRAGSDFAERHLAVLEKSAQRILSTLYKTLIAPVASRLPQGTAAAPGRLVIVPHALLHQVPFQALFDGQSYLVEHFEISYAPSAAVFALCQERVRQQPRRGVIGGVADELIPAVAQETAAVAGLFEQIGLETTWLLNEACNLAAFQNAVPGCDWLHLACHGLFRADNPIFSSLKLADGWLMAANVMTLDLTNSLVTLSACESGRSRVISGDEVIGLPRAFLGAGASSVVVSLWLVPDNTTAILMRHWYEQLQQQNGRAVSLRSAQLALKANHPHPYYWAPFVLNGQR